MYALSLTCDGLELWWSMMVHVSLWWLILVHDALMFEVYTTNKDDFFEKIMCWTQKRDYMVVPGDTTQPPDKVWWPLPEIVPVWSVWRLGIFGCRTYVIIHIYIYIYIYTYHTHKNFSCYIHVYIHTSIYIYIYIQRERET